MKKTEAIYYSIMAIIFILLIFNVDFLNIKKQLPIIFLTEFAATLIMFGHSFYLSWNKDVGGFFRKKSILELIFTYLFFYVWIGIILLRNNYLFSLISFILSSVLKGLRIQSSSRSIIESQRSNKLATFQFIAMFLSMFGVILLSIFKFRAESLASIWGVFYFSILGAMILLMKSDSDLENKKL